MQYFSFTYEIKFDRIYRRKDKEKRIMARICPLTGKGPLSGNQRSHSLRASRRVFNPNLQKCRVEIDGRVVTLRLSARARRTLLKNAR